jgi:nucleoside-diphosphate-sugar epimerase
MRVFVTGATGFVGSQVVTDLIQAGHEVMALSRSEGGAERLRASGATPVVGDVNDLRFLRLAVDESDAVVHTAFDHARPDSSEPSENDRRVIASIGEAFSGSERPIVVTSGTGWCAHGRAGRSSRAVDPHRHPSSRGQPRKKQPRRSWTAGSTS